MSQRTLSGAASGTQTGLHRSVHRTHQQTLRSNLESESRSQSEGEDEHQEQVNEHTCPECATDEHLVVDGTETYCQACGLVVARDILDRQLQWETADDGEKQRVRGGAPTTIRRHDKGLPTEIGYYKDGYGNELPSKIQRRFNRLRKWDDRAKADSTRARSLRTGLGEVSRLVSAAELSASIHDRAAKLFRDAWNANLLHGRDIESVATASIFAACRLERVPRFLEDFAAVARVGESDIKSAYKSLNHELELATPPPLPQDFLPQLADAVDAHPRISRRANQIATAPAVGILANGRQPSGVAAACLYYAHEESELTNIRLTQQELAAAGHTTATTIRKNYRGLVSLQDSDDLPDPDGSLEDYAR
jgi:transcription initiation factor TFIIB